MKKTIGVIGGDGRSVELVHILKERDSYIVEDDELVYAIDEEGNEKKGTKGYFKLLDALDEYLTDYVVSFEGEEYEVGEKLPVFIFLDGDKEIGRLIGEKSLEEIKKYIEELN